MKEGREVKEGRKEPVRVQRAVAEGEFGHVGGAKNNAVLRLDKGRHVRIFHRRIPRQDPTPRARRVLHDRSSSLHGHRKAVQRTDAYYTLLGSLCVQILCGCNGLAK